MVGGMCEGEVGTYAIVLSGVEVSFTTRAYVIEANGVFLFVEVANPFLG